MTEAKHIVIPTDPAWPAAAPDQVALSYDPPADTLYVDLTGAPRPGVARVLDVDDEAFAGVYPMTDEASGRVVGVMVEGYLAHAARTRPAWLALAPFAGIPEEAFAAAGTAVPKPGDRQVAVAAFLADVQVAWQQTTRLPAARG